MREPHKIFILTDCGSGIGYGHLVRCSSIAREIIKLGCCIETLCYHSGGEVFGDDCMNLDLCDWTTEENVNSRITENDIVIIDSYRPSAEFYTGVSNKCRRLIVLDDYARIPYQADLIINPNVYFEPSQYSEILGEVAGGGDYAIVRPEFKAAKPHEVKKELKKILIMAGGSDYRQLLPMMVREIIPQFPEVDFQIVSGSDESKSALEADAGLYENCQVFARLDAASLAQLMVQADLAITTCGQTTIEFSVIGTPMIGICIDLDQELYRNFYTAQKLFLSTLNWDDPELKEKIAVDIDRMRSESMRAAISSKLKKLIDGKGAKRIAQKVIND